MILHLKDCNHVTRSRGVVISRERVNLFFENEDELGILDIDDQGFLIMRNEQPIDNGVVSLG